MSYQLSVISYQLQEAFGNNLLKTWNIPAFTKIVTNTPLN